MQTINQFDFNHHHCNRQQQLKVLRLIFIIAIIAIIAIVAIITTPITIAGVIITDVVYSVGLYL